MLAAVAVVLGEMMNKWLSVFVVVSAFSALARAEEDEDDPKSAGKQRPAVHATPPRVSAPASAPAPAPAPAAPTPKRAPAGSATNLAAPGTLGTTTTTAPRETGPRTVRVRLADGQMVIGWVHAELPDAMLVDCSLGQLSIPRSRIATIAYDAAAAAHPAPPTAPAKK